jgi:NitT/TauT family transport system ATP-binding protein
VADDLVFDGVCFEFVPATPVLADLDFRVPAGQVAALIGLSGCGKSTVLRLAAGLLAPTAGSVQVDPGARAFVFQRPTLLPWRSVADNVRLPLELAGDLEDAQDRVDDVLGRVGLADAGQRLPRELSGGMAMRVSLARALVTRPQLLLLDEPFSALDAFTRRQLQEEVLALQQSLGLTTVLVTHDVDEAALFSHEVIVLSGKPAGVGALVPVALPWPRTVALLRDPALASVSRRIEEAV